MLRRSARLGGSTSARTPVGSDLRAESPTSSPTAAIGNYEDSPGMDSESSDEEHVRPKKRQKQSKSKKPHSLQFKNVRGRRGALKDIVEMPLDILHEIFMYLTPVEVLSLSRMCKALRRILMTKSAECIWKQARLNLDDFPNCPDDLNEVQFASLIFGTLCDYCNKTKGRYFIWSNRRRCCGACITHRNGLIRFYNFQDARVLRGYPRLLPIVPSINPRSKTETLPIHSNESDLLCEQSAVQLVEEYRQKYCQLDDQAKKAWIWELMNERERRITHGRLCEEWLEKRNDLRAAHLNETRQRRCEAIKQRLTDLGWAKELETIEDMADWPHVWQPKDLTDRIWQNIKDDIIAKMEEYRTYRLQQDYLAAQSSRRILLGECVRDLQQKNLGKVICPDIFVLESMAQIAALIKAPTEETVEFPESLLLELIQNWRQSCDTELRNMIIAGSTPTSKPNVVDPLSLATTLFYCWKKCDRPLPYPEILNHSCATLINYTQPCLWNVDGKRIFFDVKTYSLAKTILEASGLDPETTTRKDVQWPEFHIECHECPRLGTNGKRVFMSWTAALWHSHKKLRNKHPRMARADLNDLDDTELKRVQKLAVDHLQLSYKEDYLCVRCKEPRVVDNWSRMKHHINEQHKNDQEPGEPAYLTDYVLEIEPSGFCRQPGGLLILEPEDGQ